MGGPVDGKGLTYNVVNSSTSGVDRCLMGGYGHVVAECSPDVGCLCLIYVAYISLNHIPSLTVVRDGLGARAVLELRHMSESHVLDRFA